MKNSLTIALVGNPNSGKSTIFNKLTGGRQQVGNYPGVTVEKVEGFIITDEYNIKVIDLPGTYSLTAHSIDEQIARNYIIHEKPDVIVDIIDYSNLERNLYLTLQLIELGVPLVLIFNMSDIARERGISYNLDKLPELLGAPIVPTVGHKSEGEWEIIETILSLVSGRINLSQPNLQLGGEIEREIARILQFITANNLNPNNYNIRWLALKLLENDREILREIKSPELKSLVRISGERLKSTHGENPEIVIAEQRYKLISDICRKTVLTRAKEKLTRSDRIDLILTNRVVGLPIFLMMMFLLFHLTFTVGGYPMHWIEALFSWLSIRITGLWQPGSESALKSLLVDGIIGGVGGVIVFLPNIMLLFFGLAVLEDSGYMGRAALIMDGIMQRIGLQGRSFVPMLTGFGCTVPAILATRTLESRRDRLTTMMVLPLMSCGARFPIYALIIPAFFPERQRGLMLYIIYIIGIVLAILLAKLLRISLLKGPALPLVMELPLYRLPTLNSLVVNMWRKSWLYIRKAGTVILGISIILWALTSYPKFRGDSALTYENQQAQALEYSIAGRIGHAIEPVLKPMGFDWKIGTAMIGAFAAKEVFVAQLGIIFSVGDKEEEKVLLREKLQRNYTPLVGFAIMLFMLIATPCMATVAVTRLESGSWRWALLQFGGLTVLAYILTVLVFQVGTVLEIGT